VIFFTSKRVAKGETILLCQKKKQLNARAKTNAKASRLPLRRANLCAKKWNTFGKASMAPARRSRRSPLVSPRQVAFHSGGRICARRNGTHSGRQAWRPLAGAGDRHWSLRGTSSRSKVTASKTRPATNKEPGKARSRKGPFRIPQEAFSDTLASNDTRAQARESSVRIKAGIVGTREARSAAALSTIAFGCREESGEHTKASPLRCSVDRARRRFYRAHPVTVKL